MFLAIKGKGMKRYAIFLGIGPLIGYVLAIGEMLLLRMPPDLWWVFPGVMFAYVVGLIPAGLAALADSKRKNIALTIVVGGVASAMWPVVQAMLSTYGLEGVPVYAVIGMIAAAACSWLSSENQNGGAR
jgi:hypothetical protein